MQINMHNCCYQCSDLISSYICTVVEDEEKERADVVITIRELDDVLMKDVGNKIAASGK